MAVKNCRSLINTHASFQSLMSRHSLFACDQTNLILAARILSCQTDVDVLFCSLYTYIGNKESSTQYYRMAKKKENNLNDNTTVPAVKIIICTLTLLVIGLAVAIIIISVNNSKDSDSMASCGKTSSLKQKYRIKKSQDLYRDLSEAELLQVRDYILNDASLKVTPIEKVKIFRESYRTPSCPKTSPLKPKYTKSNDLYRDLSKAELLQVCDYILNVASLNVTPFEKATVNSNYIFLIELQNPIKDDAIAYLDRNGPKPTRVANVIIFKGAVSPPVVEEILVYFDKPMRHEPNTLLTDREIPFHARPSSKYKNAISEKIIDDFVIKAHQVLDGLFGGYVINNCTDRCLRYYNIPPRAMPNSDELLSVAWFVRDVPGSVLQPVGLELLIQGEGNDGSKWKTRVSATNVYCSKTFVEQVASVQMSCYYRYHMCTCSLHCQWVTKR